MHLPAFAGLGPARSPKHKWDLPQGQQELCHLSCHSWSQELGPGLEPWHWDARMWPSFTAQSQAYFSRMLNPKIIVFMDVEITAIAGLPCACVKEAPQGAARWLPHVPHWGATVGGNLWLPALAPDSHPCRPCETGSMVQWSLPARWKT